MNIDEQFNLIAKEYDCNRRKFIPCFDDFYESTTKLVLSNYGKLESVLDLGAGTGLLTSYWYKECSTAKYTMIDIADDMLDIARKRFAGTNNVTSIIMNYDEAFPIGDFEAVISALSIHHLEDFHKERLFKSIFKNLPTGGIFVNYDQFCADTPKVNQWYNSYWESQLYTSGLTKRDVELWKERRKLDKECSVDTEMQMLNGCGFSEVNCIYSYHKFSVIVAIK